MSDDDRARNRWLAITGTRLAGTVGAVFGLLLVGRGPDVATKVVGVALVLSALLMIAIVPRSLAQRWRTPPKD